MITVARALVEFVLRTQVYLVVAVLLLWYPVSSNDLYGYLAMFVATSYVVAFILFIFRSSFRPTELFIPFVMSLGIGYLLVEYFYLSGRTDLYWMGVYAAGVGAIETIHFLYHHPNLEKAFSGFSFFAHACAAMVSVGIVFFATDVVSVSEYRLMKAILILYVSFGIFMNSLYMLRSVRWIDSKTYEKVTIALLGICYLFLVVSLFVSFAIFKFVNQSA